MSAPVLDPTIVPVVDTAPWIDESYWLAATAPDDHTCHIVCWADPRLPLCGTDRLPDDDGWCPADCPNTCLVCDDLHDHICFTHGTCPVCGQACWAPYLEGLDD